MPSTTSPLIGAALSLVLVFAGLYLRTSDGTSAQVFGAVFIGVGVIGALANLAIYVVTRRR